MSEIEASVLIDEMIAGIDDWRGLMLAQVRTAIVQADTGIIEEWKWMGSPTWSCDGIIVVGNPHKDKVKLTFAHGAALPDPDGLFNGKDTGNTRRSIDIFEGQLPDVAALQALVRAAITYNRARKAASGKKA